MKNNMHENPNDNLHMRLDAVLFDMDGVITDTARGHVFAWNRLFDEFLQTQTSGVAEDDDNRLRPFDVNSDYRLYVDGKPRHDGIRSFLKSRNIELPEGATNDPPGLGSVRALGQRKQDYFLNWLEENRVRPFPGTIRLIKDLQEHGIKIAVFSSSRNMELVLRSAGVYDLFQVKVDGKDLATLKLLGKPDPAILYEATERLGVPRQNVAVIEDAVAGVEAGAKGRFAQVIGVNRGDYGDALVKAGAHMVVQDLSELTVDKAGRLGVKTLANLPILRDHTEVLHSKLSGRSPVVFLDYDGTLTPIVEDHDKAFLADDMRSAIQELATHCIVAIVSGRDLSMVRQLVGIDSVYFAGSHGFEISGPKGSNEKLEQGVEFLGQIDDAEEELRQKLSEIPGHDVERQRLSIAVHFRKVPPQNLAEMESIVIHVISRHPRLRLGHGKKIFRIQPAIEWDKGRAVNWLLEKFNAEERNLFPIYFGDDQTDEDAFYELSGRGLSVVVTDHESR